MNLPETPKFTVKERRYFDYMCNEKNSRNIGDMCKALHTTVRTLFKTQQAVEQKVNEWGKQYDKWVKYWGLED